jgi:hypothetical protein
VHDEPRADAARLSFEFWEEGRQSGALVAGEAKSFGRKLDGA